MNKNLIKILSTIGLIVAIALILKGVFGISKISVNKMTNKEIIRFDECFDVDEMANYQEHKADSDFDRWYIDVDLSKMIATRSLVRKDERIKINKEKYNMVLPKFDMDNFKLISKTDDFAKTENFSLRKNEFGYDEHYLFSFKDGKMQLFQSYGTFNSVSNFQCKLYFK